MQKQEDQQSSKAKSSQMKIVIIILSVLLICAAGCLAGRMIYLRCFAPKQTTVIVPDNLIGEEHAPEKKPTAPDSNRQTPGQSESGTATGAASSTATDSAADKPKAVQLQLYQGKPGDNEKFEVRNIFPGDTETKYFCITAYHDADITLCFETEVTEQTKALGDVLHITVTRLDTGKVLCDAPFAEINGKEFSELWKPNTDEETTVYYRIDVSLDTSVGNQYQAALLKAEYNWYIMGEDGLIRPPQTGDTVNIMLWVVLALSSLLLMFFWVCKRRKEGEQHA